MSKREPKPRLTHSEALTEYFGSLQKIARTALPFKCKCGHEAYSLELIWSHFRKDHREFVLRKEKRQDFN